MIDKSNNEVKNVLIVGNGFDLSYGLPTTYPQFIHFINFITRLENPKTLTFSDIYEQDFREIDHPQKNLYKDDSKYDEWLINIKDKYDCETLVFDLSKFDKNTILNNKWSKYFIDLNKNPADEFSWIDFENEISKILKNIQYFIENKVLYNDIFFSNDLSLYQIGILEVNNEPFAHLDYNYKLKKEHVLKVNGIGFKINVQKILKFLLHELKIFANLFKKYIQFIVNEFLEGILSSEYFNRDGLPYPYYFHECYSFNYTSTPLTMRYALGSPSLVDHIKFIHGSASDTNEIIFGVDYNDINSDVLGDCALEFSKYFQTIYHSTNYNIVDDERTYYNFFIWGHSLGNSDRKYIDVIIECLELNTKNTKVPNTLTIYFHDLNSKASLIKKLFIYYTPKKIEHYIRNKYLKLLENPN